MRPVDVNTAILTALLAVELYHLKLHGQIAEKLARLETLANLEINKHFKI